MSCLSREPHLRNIRMCSDEQGGVALDYLQTARENQNRSLRYLEALRSESADMKELTLHCLEGSSIDSDSPELCRQSTAHPPPAHPCTCEACVDGGSWSAEKSDIDADRPFEIVTTLLRCSAGSLQSRDCQRSICHGKLPAENGPLERSPMLEPCFEIFRSSSPTFCSKLPAVQSPFPTHEAHYWAQRSAMQVSCGWGRAVGKNPHTLRPPSPSPSPSPQTQVSSLRVKGA